jgi:hypothetical protein
VRYITVIKNKGTNLLCSFWDSVCIDQANTAERNHQVSQMGQIYSRAERVYLWLGANKELAPVLPFLRDPEAATLQQWHPIHAHVSALENYICGNEYWNVLGLCRKSFWRAQSLSRLMRSRFYSNLCTGPSTTSTFLGETSQSLSLSHLPMGVWIHDDSLRNYSYASTQSWSAAELM